MKIQKLYSYVRQALDDYNMIDENDVIAIGISGGKDSLTLLYALAGLQNFYPKSFSIKAITVDLGYENFDTDPLKALCNQLDVEYHVVHTQIGQMVADNLSDKSHCSLCARLRKGALNDAAKQLGCNKVAYAHHMDDMIETMFMSLLFEGKFYSFPPVTKLDRTELTVIRPLMYVPECDVIGFENKMKFPIVKNPCPYDGHTKRQYVKDLIRTLNIENPGVKKRLFHAILNGKFEDWPTLIEKEGK